MFRGGIQRSDKLVHLKNFYQWPPYYPLHPHEDFFIRGLSGEQIIEFVKFGADVMPVSNEAETDVLRPGAERIVQRDIGQFFLDETGALQHDEYAIAHRIHEGMDIIYIHCCHKYLSLIAKTGLALFPFQHIICLRPG